MKIRLSQKPRGIALGVTLGMITIVTVILVGYVTLANSQFAMVTRSQEWNEAIPIAEAGVDEAMSQLSYAGANSNLLTSNSWTYSGGLYHKSRSFSDGSSYNVAIQVAANPIIYSTSSVPANSTWTNVSRRIKVTVSLPSGGSAGVFSVGPISMTGGGSIDAFNSLNTNYSSNGLYVASMREANALVETDSTATGAISVQGKIYGSVNVGWGGTVTTSGGAVGSLSWDATNSNGIQPGYSTNNANMIFTNVTAPFAYGTGTTPVSATYNGTFYNYVLSNGNYNMLTTSINGGQAMAVTGNAVLYVNGDFTTSGSGYIYIASNASLTMIVNGNVTVSGGGVDNTTDLASHFNMLATSNCTTMTVSGSAATIGTIYAPQAALTVSGSGGMYGAVSANTVLISGGASIHVDDGLLGNSTTATVLNWDEF